MLKKGENGKSRGRLIFKEGKSRGGLVLKKTEKGIPKDS